MTFSSPTAGTVTGNASVTFLVGGVSLTRDTDPATANVGAGPGGSGPAVKHFLAGSISWLKHDNAGALQGGATFELCRTNDYDLDAGDFGPLLDPAVCITVVDDVGDANYVGNDEDPDPGEFLVSDRPLGRYTITETVAPPGFIVDPTPQTVELTPGNTTGSADDPFVNNRPIVKITGFGYTNEATWIRRNRRHRERDRDVLGRSPQLRWGGRGPVELVDRGERDRPPGVERSAATATILAPALSKALTGTIAAEGDVGDDLAFTLVCTYTDMPDGKVIGAVLNVNYTLDGSPERAASGSPANVSFTVQSD